MREVRTLPEILNEAMETCIIKIGKGLSATDKKKIAKKAGVHFVTVYRYLKSGKENEILWSALNEVLEERKRKLNEMRAKAGLEPIK